MRANDQTFGALLNALFTAITVGPIGQGDLRANGVIVVRGEVVRHAQAVGQLENKRTMTKQVVVVHMTDTSWRNSVSSSLAWLGRS